MNPASFAFAAQHLYQFLNADGLPVVFNKLKLFPSIRENLMLFISLCK